MSLSARATGLLVHCVYTGTNPTVTDLTKAFKEGKEAIRAALTELADQGLLDRKVWKVGNRIMTQCSLNEKAKDYLKMAGYWVPQNCQHEKSWRVSGELIQLNELTNTSSNIAKDSKKITHEVREEFKTMNVEVDNVAGWNGMFDATASDELIGERRIAQAAKKAAYVAKKEELRNKRVFSRYETAIVEWTSGDIGFEFAHRIEEQWHIPPWEVKSSRFIPALGQNRMRYDTDGEIEYTMIDLFLSSIDFQKYDNAEHLCWLFIKRFGELALQAKSMVRSDEEIEDAASQAKKSQEWLYE